MFTWNKENIKRLKSLWEIGNTICRRMNASVIAKELGTSKNSVLGKAFRLNLKKKQESRRTSYDSFYRGSSRRKVVRKTHQDNNNKSAKKGGTKSKFKHSETMKKFWAKNKGNYSSRENPKATKNDIRGLRRGVRLLNKLNTIEKTIDSKDYVMPTYRYGFIKYESFTPRNSNRLKYRMLIPKEVYIKWTQNKRQEEKNKMFDTKVQVVYTIRRLEKEHIDDVKAKYDKYFETRNY